MEGLNGGRLMEGALEFSAFHSSHGDRQAAYQQKEREQKMERVFLQFGGGPID